MQSLRRFSFGLLQASKSAATSKAASPVAAFHTKKPSNAESAPAAAAEVANGRIIAVIGAVVDVQVRTEERNSVGSILSSSLIIVGGLHEIERHLIFPFSLMEVFRQFSTLSMSRDATPDLSSR